MIVGQQDDTASLNPSMIVEFDGTSFAQVPEDNFVSGTTRVTNLYAAWGGPTSAYAAGVEGYVLRRGEAGTPWSENAKLGVTVMAIAGPDDRHLFAVGQNGRIWRHTPP